MNAEFSRVVSPVETRTQSFDNLESVRSALEACDTVIIDIDSIGVISGLCHVFELLFNLNMSTSLLNI
jgi:hypothetical protein